MEVIIAGSADEVGRIAAERIARECGRRLQPVLGVATGSSPLGTYQHLAELQRRGGLDLAHARVFALDEYVGLPADDPRSYADTIRRTVTEPLGLDPSLVQVPDGTAGDLPQACQHFEQLIREAGGVDVQLLGIGSNGHIGFNEPASSLASRTRVKTLTAATREANARFFDDPEQVPSHVLTQGLGTIMEARTVVLVALGADKAQAVADAVEGPVSARCPASVLQFHPHVAVVVDESAAALLGNDDYYRHVQELAPRLPGARR